MMKFLKRTREKVVNLLRCAARHLACNKGENFVDSAIKILIVVVLGALLLAGLYMIFKDTLLPTLTQKIMDLFNYSA